MFELLKKKKNKKAERVGEEFPFTLLTEDEKGNIKFSYNVKWNILHNKNGKKYWECLKPYKIIDGNLCVRIADKIVDTHDNLFIVFTKEELINIFEEMKQSELN